MGKEEEWESEVEVGLKGSVLVDVVVCSARQVRPVPGPLGR